MMMIQMCCVFCAVDVYQVLPSALSTTELEANLIFSSTASDISIFTRQETATDRSILVQMRGRI